MNPALARQSKIMWVLGLVFLIVTYFVVLNISRIGETKVVVTVVPDDSKLLVNDSAVKAGAIYLKPGIYTFTASKQGFSEDKQKVTVGKETAEVGLLPEPDSKAARKYLENNPDIQSQREALGGAKAAKRGQELEKKAPIISLLPYTDIAGPFSIDYGPTQNGDVFLLVSDSSPRGRQNALKWIKQQGYDPTDLDIRFEGFTNPLLGTGASNE